MYYVFQGSCKKTETKTVFLMDFSDKPHLIMDIEIKMHLVGIPNIKKLYTNLKLKYVKMIRKG